MIKRNALTLTLAALVLAASLAPAYAQATDDHAVVTDTRGNVVRNTYDNCVRTKWDNDGDPCAPSKPPVVAVVAPPPPPPPPPPAPQKHTVISQADRTVYFPFNKASLTDQAKAQLNTLASTLKAAKDIQAAQIVGTADRIGSKGYNNALSEKRAIVVRDYLIGQGYTNTSVTKTRWIGDSEPTTNCSKKMAHAKQIACLQNDRRVEVQIVYRTETVTTPAK
ncbi:MAG: OmpA family protein [Pseudomonadota bacterium]|nr:OmpA family protein [Pseudomonadota bacterium]